MSGPMSGPMSDEPAYVSFAAVDWWYHNKSHSELQLMRAVARRRTVLLVNSIGMRMPLPGRTPQAARRVARKVTAAARGRRTPLPELPQFHVMTPIIIPAYGSPAGRSLNTRLIRGQVGTACRHIGIRRAIAFVTVPTAWEVVKDMSFEAIVFNRSDRHSAFDEVNQDYIRGLEHALLAQSSLVVYASSALFEQERHLTGDRAMLLDHGVDLDHFHRWPVSAQPADLLAIPRPRIGFFGGFDDYTVDFELLGRLARALPNAQLVLIGAATCSMRPLTRLPNVHWLGQRPYEEIPRYGSGFDVALMPWLRNDWIRASNPVKLKEYLALGLPVVSTDFPEVHRYAEVVAIAEDGREFVSLVERGLAGDAPGTAQSRRSRVAAESWHRQADRLLAHGDAAAAAQARRCAAS